MNKTFCVIYAKLTKQEPVVLQDCDGEITFTVAKRNSFDELIAYRFWLARARRVVLNPDGTISPECYVKRWARA